MTFFQIPQYLLEEGREKGRGVRLIVTLPDRLSAILSAERVAEERGERVGGTVGYQIRLESRVSPCDTLLTYCTAGVLLRTLSAPDYTLLTHTTHLVVDEIQERDSATDFLLASLKDVLPLVAPHLRLILVGNDLDFPFFAQFMCLSPDALLTIHTPPTIPPLTPPTLYLDTILDMMESSTLLATSSDPLLQTQHIARQGLSPLSLNMAHSSGKHLLHPPILYCTLKRKVIGHL